MTGVLTAGADPDAFAFCKLEGAGNDFITVDDRSAAFPCEDGTLIRSLTDRRTGIGADGILLLQVSADADARMRIFNADGGEAEMCGNGLRCLARFAHDLGLPASLRVETRAGIVRAEVAAASVRLHLPEMSLAEFIGLHLMVAGREVEIFFLNTGVPHALVFGSVSTAVEVLETGRVVRNHSAFAPAGTNVDFVTVRPDGGLDLRTYERGVEAETAACGTGAVAAALAAAWLEKTELPVTVHCPGGVLEVGAELAGSNAQRVTLTGPARSVFRGVFSVAEMRGER